MTKVIGHIYEESDYSKFRQLEGNRNVLSGRLNKIIASISDKYILNPIIVNELYEVIDGQGRFEACKALGRPIHFIVAKDATIEDCRRMNKYNSKWTSADFVDSYCRAGKESYIALKKACAESGLNMSTVLRLTNKYGKDHPTRDARLTLLERGDLIFSQEDVQTVKDIATAANEILEALQITYRPNLTFYAAIKVIYETDGYDHSRMIKNCKANRSTYNQMSNLKGQLEELERIYNYRAKAGKLYFSDYMRNKGYQVNDYRYSESKKTRNSISSLI